MTIGKTRLRLSAALLLGLLLPPAWAGELTLEQLMAGLRARGDIRAQFVETKHLAVLRGVMEVRGTLEFRQPDYLKREHTSPRAEIYEIEAGTITISQPGKASKQVALADFPPLAAFIDSLRAILSGDADTIERLYRTELSGTDQAWTLTLTPRDRNLADYIDWVKLEGREQRLIRIETQEAIGDRSVLELK